MAGRTDYPSWLAFLDTVRTRRRDEIIVLGQEARLIAA
jgi:hypothetical protein